MKKHLSIVVMLLVLAVMLTSCSWLPTSLTDKLGIFYTISYDLGGADQSFEDTFVLKDKPFELPTPQRENYEFEGWYTAGGELFTSESPLTASVKLTAKWRQTHYTITYNCGEIAESFTKSAPLGEYPSKPATPEVEGYVFTGWYLDEGYTERYFFDRLLNKDTTLYAKFYDTKLGEYIVISNVEQLMAIGNPPATDESTGETIVPKYLLACDINCKGETITPIKEFSGELDGNGYRIFNFAFNETSNTIGFIRTNNGIIKNLYFADFTFDYNHSVKADRFFGIVAGINNGTIDNCHIDNSPMNIKATLTGYGAGYVAKIGGVSGRNRGIISNCSNALEINVTAIVQGNSVGGWDSSYLNMHPDVGGIVGLNETKGTITNCNNTGNISLSIDTRYASWYKGGNRYTTAQMWANVGGIVANNSGSVNNSIHNGNLNAIVLNSVDSNESMNIKVGGAIGYNCGTITNSCAMGNVTLSGKKVTDGCVGGFVASNQLKVYNCYTSVNVNDSTPAAKGNKYIGSFAGYNKMADNAEQATITKCFSTGSVTLVSTPTHSGPFVGLSSNTEKDCFYLDTATAVIVTVVDEVETLVPIEFTNTSGEAKDAGTLLSVDFIENTLYFDRDIWLLIDGQLPTIK